MKLRSILAAAAAVLAPCAAHAGVTGQVTIDHFTYTLTDLDPNDGLAPSITFLPAPTAGASAGSGTLMFQYSAGKVSGSPFIDGAGKPSMAASYTAQGLTVGGSLDGAAALDTASLSLYASADQSYGQQVSAWANANSRWVDFVLSPNTALTIQADAHFAGEITGADMNRLDMEGGLWLTGEDANQNAVSHYFTADAGILPTPTPAFDRIESVVGSYANATAASFSGQLLMFAMVDALALPAAVTAPVPEPARGAMLAAGLPLLLILRGRARPRPGDAARA